MSFWESFSHSTSQKIGLFFVGGIILFTSAYRWWDHELRDKDPISPKVYAAMDALEAEGPATSKKPKAVRTLESVDLNLADSASLDALPGIGPVLSARIVKYREARGGFDSVEGLRKIYGFSEENYQRALPYLKLSPLQRTRESAARRYSPKSPKAPPAPMDVNLASASDLDALPGLGPALSQRIVRYRDAKGGYDKIEELRKIYNLPESTYLALVPYLYVDSTTLPVRKPKATTGDRREGEQTSTGLTTSPAQPPTNPIDLNVADSAALDALPGIGPVLAKRILRYREILGFYAEVEQLKSVYGLSAENYARMAPQLYVGDLSEYPRADLNAASHYKLSILPLLSKDGAQRVLDRRRELGRFENWEEVATTPDLDAAALAELRNYFSIPRD